MVIDQRNAGASVTPTADSTYTLDRWKARLSQPSKYSVQQNAGSVTPPAGFTNYLGVTSLAATSLAAGDFYSINQLPEGFNIADFGWGTANAKTVTMSFWVRSSLTGTFGGSFTNASFNRAYSFTYTISTANTWEQKSITIVGDTSGTWNSTNGIGIEIWFSLGAGSTYTNGTANAWTAGGFVTPTGATSVVGTNGATFYITGVQLEVGSSATSFEYRPYGTELLLCQRYFQSINGSFGMSYSSSEIDFQITFKTNMRANPSLALISGTITVDAAGLGSSTSSGAGIAGGQYNTMAASFRIGGWTGLTQWRPYPIFQSANWATASAEL
jgi:hypothetical protein